MAKGTTYYYFRVRRPSLTLIVPYEIKVSSVYIDDNIMLNFKQMTEEQKAFYLEHPTASVQEIWKCELNPHYVPPTPDLQEYIELKVKELSDACYGSVTISSLQYAMALDKVENITADSFYTLTEARQTSQRLSWQQSFCWRWRHVVTALHTQRCRRGRRTLLG